MGDEVFGMGGLYSLILIGSFSSDLFNISGDSSLQSSPPHLMARQTDFSLSHDWAEGDFRETEATFV